MINKNNVFASNDCYIHQWRSGYRDHAILLVRLIVVKYDTDNSASAPNFTVKF